MLFAATMKEKAVACENESDLNMAYELWHNQKRDFLFFVFQHHCQVLKQNARIDVIKDKDELVLLDKEVTLVRWINGREFWVRRNLIQK